MRCRVDGCSLTARTKGLCATHYSRSRYLAKRDEILARKAEQRRADPEGSRARGREAYKKNPEMYRAASQAWRAKQDPATLRAAEKEYRKKSPDYETKHRARARAYQPGWRQANPEKAKAQSHRRLTLKARTSGQFTGDEWQAVLEAYGHRCRNCASAEALSLDHIVPLTKGGTSNIWNLQPLCGPCNSSKSNKMPPFAISHGVR